MIIERLWHRCASHDIAIECKEKKIKLLLLDWVFIRKTIEASFVIDLTMHEIRFYELLLLLATSLLFLKEKERKKQRNETDDAAKRRKKNFFVDKDVFDEKKKTFSRAKFHRMNFIVALIVVSRRVSRYFQLKLNFFESTNFKIGWLIFRFFGCFRIEFWISFDWMLSWQIRLVIFQFFVSLAFIIRYLIFMVSRSRKQTQTIFEFLPMIRINAKPE